MSNPFKAGDVIRFANMSFQTKTKYIVLIAQGETVTLFIPAFFKKVGTFHYSIMELHHESV